jgi:hypothetical protein
MEFREFLNKQNINEKIKTIVEASANEDKKYYNMKDENGNRYAIPMLSKEDPEYREKYIYYMKLKEKDEAAFNKVMNWG